MCSIVQFAPYVCRSEGSRRMLSCSSVREVGGSGTGGILLKGNLHEMDFLKV